MKRFLLPLLLLVPAAAMAEPPSLDLRFNDTSAQVRLSAPLFDSDDYGYSLLSGRFLYNDKEETTLGSAGFDFVGEPGGIPGLKLGVGTQLYGGRADDGQDLLALGVGTRVDYAPPVLGGFGLGGRVFYAPNIFSWLDAERLLETEVSLSYALLPKVTVNLSYQNIRTDFDDHGDWTIDEGVRLGFEARF